MINSSLRIEPEVRRQPNKNITKRMFTNTKKKLLKDRYISTENIYKHIDGYTLI